MWRVKESNVQCGSWKVLIELWSAWILGNSDVLWAWNTWCTNTPTEFKQQFLGTMHQGPQGTPTSRLHQEPKLIVWSYRKARKSNNNKKRGDSKWPCWSPSLGVTYHFQRDTSPSQKWSLWRSPWPTSQAMRPQRMVSTWLGTSAAEFGDVAAGGNGKKLQYWNWQEHIFGERIITSEYTHTFTYTFMGKTLCTYILYISGWTIISPTSPWKTLK